MVQVGKYEIDAQRTVELSLSGTLVESGKGDPDHFFCVPLSVVSQTVCPRCGCSNLRNQGSIQRSYLDVIPRGDDAAVITVTIEFRKNKCMNPDCNCVFYPEIPFAGRYSRTTHRLENAIVRMVIRGCLSFTESAELLEGKLSRQVVGQIYHRRVQELETDPTTESDWYRQLLRAAPFYWFDYDSRGWIWKRFLK